MELIFLIIAPMILAVFCIALVYSNLGIGGGVLYVPLLLSLTTLSMREVVPISLLFVLATATSSTINHYRKGLVDFRLGGILTCGAVFGAIMGALFTLKTQEKIVMSMFTIVLVGVGIKMFLDIYKNKGDEIEETKTRLLLASIIFIGAGFLSGSMGIGGGGVNVPLMIYVLGLGARRAMGTSYFIIIGASIVGFSTYVFSGGSIEYTLAITLLPFVFVGAFVGSRWGLQYLVTPTVKKIFVAAILLAIVKMIITLF